MLGNGKDSWITPDIVHELREAARRGTSVRDMVGLLQQRWGRQEAPIIPVLAAFVEAFSLPLIKVLPIREWLGTNYDAAIDAMILPEIEQARCRWDREKVVELAEGK